ncbi:MAG TPA: PEP-CTERM/exosortase system-associated acyltransferase, partial [Alphaproteobacteria bacterium]|nr:PEP-CTERM/exosortase system-associated acyltransferase [Alphaproteobacteria bacterium]
KTISLDGTLRVKTFQVHEGGLEYDAYDKRSRHVLLRYRPTGQNIGTIRVIMPDQEQALNSFPMQTSCDHPILKNEAKSSSLCEISRLCVSQNFRRRLNDGSVLPDLHLPSGLKLTNPVTYFLSRRVIPFMPLGLFRGAFEEALLANRLECMGAMEPKLIRSLRRLGFFADNLGGTINLHGIRQPVMFNINSLYDRAKAEKSILLPFMTDYGRLHSMASTLSGDIAAKPAPALQGYNEEEIIASIGAMNAC